MEYSNFIILLARQRSGTHAVRSILSTNPDVFCFHEVFNLHDVNSDDVFIRETNFFNFLRTRVAHSINRIYDNYRESILFDYIDYLRCFTQKKHILIDVKYSTTHFITQPHVEITQPFPLFELIKSNRVKVFVLMRRNYLRYVVSLQKAKKTGVYAIDKSSILLDDMKIYIKTDHLLYALNKCHDEDQIIHQQFSKYAQALFYDYADIFTSANGGIDNHFLNRFSDWLSIENSFEEKNVFKKQSYLPLTETIENYEEVAKALLGTKFEYCLEDEKMYLNP